MSSPQAGASYDPPGLRPVRGSAEQLWELLSDWDTATDPAPLQVETSGSTGRPKRVVLSRAAMRASADATHARLGGSGRWASTLPPTYVAGLQVLFRSVRAGTEPLPLGRDPERWERGWAARLDDPTQVAARERRYVSIVPTQLHRALQDERATAVLGCFDAVLVGGGALEPGLRRAAEDAGCRVVATYGMSETCGGCVYDGQPLDGVRVRLEETGRILLGGPVLFEGYAGQPTMTASVVDAGWLTTSDLGRFDDHGRLQVVGRVDDVVVSGGVNVATATVAARLREHVRVQDCEVLGVADDEWGQRVVAFVVGRLPLDEARAWVAEDLPRAWAPRQVVELEGMPLLANGKPDRVGLADRARVVGG